MANALLSPTATTKLKAKECVNRMRHGSPRFQEVLRERCRQQMKERRSQLFNKRRLGLEISAKEVQDTLTEIVRKELSNLATEDWNNTIGATSGIVNKPFDLEEALYLENEIIAEEEEWILEEYEKMSREELDLLASTDKEGDQVICPICQKSIMILDTTCVKCKVCNFQLDSCNDVKLLGRLLCQAVSSHSSICSQTPGFIMIPENSNIYLHMMCQSCSTLMPII